MQTGSKKNILVAGDLIIDNSLERLPGAELTYSGLLPNAVPTRRAGNAWFLNDLMEMACSDIKPELDIYAPGTGRGTRPADYRNRNSGPPFPGH